MWLIRLRIWLKTILRRDSLIYRLSRWIFQTTGKISRYFFPGRAAREISENSIFTQEEEMAMCSIYPKEILDLTIELFHPASVLDVGCGTGVSLDYFKKRGVDAYGMEGSALAISKAQNPLLIKQYDLHTSIDLSRKFDLVWCFEVAEHIHPRHVSNLLETLTNHGDRILLSAAQPGQGGLGHLNEQFPEYWIEKMSAYGFALDAINVRKYRQLPDHFASNILVFDRYQS
jgi:2-polyprenyl-3-methyl-5-hydroxy-6-metoxy-1,4-benzoquinol methylase